MNPSFVKRTQFASGFVFGLWVFIALPIHADTLSDNLSNPTDFTDIASGDTWLAAGFGTGNSSYLLNTVTLLMSGSSTGTAELDLYSSSQSQPGMQLGTLTSPASYPVDLGATSFAGQNLLLSPNTSYWLVLKGISGEFEWAFTNSNDGAGIGFQHLWGTTGDAGASWFTSDIQPFQFRVTADPTAAPVPEPGPMGIMIVGLLLTVTNCISNRIKHL